MAKTASILVISLVLLLSISSAWSADHDMSWTEWMKGQVGINSESEEEVPKAAPTAAPTGAPVGAPAGAPTGARIAG